MVPCQRLSLCLALPGHLDDARNGHREADSLGPQCDDKTDSGDVLPA
jgi:hypothetical protein